MALPAAVASPRPRDSTIEVDPGSGGRRRVLFLAPAAADLAGGEGGSEIYVSVETWEELDRLAGGSRELGVTFRPSLHAAELIPYPDGFFDLICASDPALVARAAPELTRTLAKAGQVQVRVDPGCHEAVKRALDGLEVEVDPAGGDGGWLLLAHHRVNGRTAAAPPPRPGRLRP